jgi:hypothetical protein
LRPARVSCERGFGGLCGIGQRSGGFEKLCGKGLALCAVDRRGRVLGKGFEDAAGVGQAAPVQEELGEGADVLRGIRMCADGTAKEIFRHAVQSMVQGELQSGAGFFWRVIDFGKVAGEPVFGLGLGMLAQVGFALQQDDAERKGRDRLSELREALAGFIDLVQVDQDPDKFFLVGQVRWKAVREFPERGSLACELCG